MHPLLQRATAEGTPIIDRTSATFVWQGDQPPYLVGDFNDWAGAPLTAWTQAGSDVWSLRLDLPDDAYIEYAFVPVPDDEARIPDPFNDRTTPNGMGHVNHFFYMPGALPSPLAERRRNVLQGRLTRHRIEHRWLLANGVRWVHLYQPAAEGPVPLAVIFDGEDYRTRGRITQIVDNLISEGRVRPLALALIDNGGRARGIEYACNDATIELLMTQVLPLASSHIDLLDPATAPGAFGVMGASMGGLMALYTGVRVPEVFGHVLSQSGAVGLGELDTALTTLVRHMPAPRLKIWMDVGRFEWLLEANRQFHALLTERGYDVTYREHNGGHNYPSWRNEVWRGLEALFGQQPRPGRG